MRGVCAFVAATLILGGWNLIDEAKGLPDWIVVSAVLPAFGFLVTVFGYWAFVRSW